MAKKDELIMTCLAYDTLFDDYTTIDIKKSHIRYTISCRIELYRCETQSFLLLFV